MVYAVTWQNISANLGDYFHSRNKRRTTFHMYLDMLS
jgi:hypothetical protein